MTAKEDLKETRISVLIHVAVASVIGLLAPFFTSGYHVIAAAIAVVIVLGHLIQKVVGKKPFSWWVGNGLFIYFFMIADVWIVIANYF